jgi:FkbM family methyltransferase
VTFAHASFFRSYVLLGDLWVKHWPMSRGKWIFERFEPLLYKLGPFPLTVEPGVQLLLDPKDTLQRHILLNREWEPLIWGAITNALFEGATFLDIGAHIGYFSLRAAARIGSSGRVIAVEPNPNSVELLRRNIAASGSSNVTVIPAACTNDEQFVSLYKGSETHSEFSSLSRKNVELVDHGTVSQVDVPGRRIDDIISDLALKCVDVIKIDVEGAEYYALQGAQHTLERFHPVLVLEMWRPYLSNMGSKLEDLIALLKNLGYSRSQQLNESNWKWEAEVPDGKNPATR